MLVLVKKMVKGLALLIGLGVLYEAINFPLGPIIRWFVV